jgi:hypothetical protein
MNAAEARKRRGGSTLVERTRRDPARGVHRYACDGSLGPSSSAGLSRPGPWHCSRGFDVERGDLASSSSERDPFLAETNSVRSS